MRIITDSSSDIDTVVAKELDITVLPLRVTFDDGTYAPYTEISNEEFYTKMNNKSELPSTSLASPGDIEEAAKPYLDNGEEVICLLMSKELSGTFQSSLVAQSNLDNKNFYTVDTLTACAGQRLMIMRAVEMRNQGKNASEIVAELEALRPKIRVMVGLTQLKNLYKGGRLSKSQAFIGGVLNIRPIVEIVDGEVKAVGKERGNAKLYNYLCNRLNQAKINQNYNIYVIHSQSHTELSEFLDAIKGQCNINISNNIHTVDIGPTIGTHVGTGAVGIAYIEE